MPHRILIAPDKFKGSLTALEAAEAMASGVRDAVPDACIDLCPIADGGEGFMEALQPALNGRWIETAAVDARGRSMQSRYLLADTDSGPVAVIEMAATAGIERLAENERDPLTATTRGVGLQLADAVRNHGVRRVFLGLGGSATNDGGCGLAAALGIRFLDADGRELDPLPVNLPQVVRIDDASRLELPPVTVACDVDNPLLGVRGATAVFSPQKGASPEDQEVLETALARLVEITGDHASAETPGAGAAGGLGFGLLHFAKASLVPGFDLLADLLDFDQRIAAADLVLTGEGSLDVQSLGGKGPVALARRARGIPVAGYCGIADDAVRNAGLFAHIGALADTGRPFEELIRCAAALLREEVCRTPLLKLLESPDSTPPHP
ncbi:glycerate kinase [Haloferula sp. A504]|uniref:glycerate kinase n=1 Tax=Haloferula sp. A504 TaxID=3373601 RepID=UPI0031BD0216|nr:glycerate kinase [Verrucomicrobiaceae bacterium E54]